MVALEDFEYFRTDLGTLYYGDTIKTLLEWYEGLTEDEMEAEINSKPLTGGQNLEW